MIVDPKTGDTKGNVPGKYDPPSEPARVDPGRDSDFDLIANS